MRENIANNTHAGFGRVDIGVAYHELFENVVLDGACKLLLFDALFFCGGNIERKDWQNRAVHRHRD